MARRTRKEAAATREALLGAAERVFRAKGVARATLSEVAAAAGVRLHEDPWEMNVHAVQRGETAAAEGHYAHVPSMLEDIRSGRRTEVDFITGSLVREARRHGVSVPLHSAIYRLVRAKEASYTQ